MRHTNTLSAQRLRYVPDDAIVSHSADARATTYRYMVGAQHAYAIFRDHAGKPYARARCASEDSCLRAVAYHIETLRERAEKHMAARIERVRYRHTLKRDDVLCCAWGYEQTSVDFYKVTRLVSATMVELQQLAAMQCEHTDPGCGTSSMTGYTKPIADVFAEGSQPFRARPFADYGDVPAVKIAGSSRRVARPWDGKPRQYSTYG